MRKVHKRTPWLLSGIRRKFCFKRPRNVVKSVEGNDTDQNIKKLEVRSERMQDLEDLPRTTAGLLVV